MKLTTKKILIVFMMMMSFSGLKSQSTVTLNRSEYSKTLRDFDKSVRDQVEHVKIIKELRLQAKKFSERLKNKDEIHKIAISKLEDAYDELGKKFRKAKRKAWFKGLWQGIVTVVTTAGIVVLVIILL